MNSLEEQSAGTERKPSDTPALGRRAFACVFGASPVMSPELSVFCTPFVFSIARNADFATRLSVLSMDMLILELTRESRITGAKHWLQEKLGKRISDPVQRALGSDACIANVMVPPGRLLHVDC